MSERLPSIVVSDSLLGEPFDDVTKSFFAAGDELSQESGPPDLVEHEPRRSIRGVRSPWLLAGAAVVAGMAFGVSIFARDQARSFPSGSLAIPSAVAAVTGRRTTARVATPTPAFPRTSSAPAVAALLPSPQHATAGAAASAEHDMGVPASLPSGQPKGDADRAAHACDQAASSRAKPRDVIAACRSAFALAPTSADVAVALARSELERGRSRQSLSWAKKALSLDATQAEAYVLLGGAEQALGRMSAARVAYRRYLQLSPQGRYAADLRAILRTW